MDFSSPPPPSVSQIVWSTFFHTLTDFSLSLNMHNLAESFTQCNSNEVVLRSLHFKILTVVFFSPLLPSTVEHHLVCLTLIFHRSKWMEVNPTWSAWLPPSVLSLHGGFCDLWEETLKKIVWAQSVSAVSWVQDNRERGSTQTPTEWVTLNP